MTKNLGEKLTQNRFAFRFEWIFRLLMGLILYNIGL